MLDRDSNTGPFPKIEADLLVTLMGNAWAWDSVADCLQVEHFTSQAGLVYETIGILVHSLRPCSLEAVQLMLRRTAKTRQLADELPARLALGVAGEARPLAILLVEEYVLRVIRERAERLHAISEPGASAARVLQEAAAEIERLTDLLPLQSEVKPLEGLIVRELDRISEAGDAAPEPEPDPHAPLNSLILPMVQPGSLVGLTGQDSAGKTTLACQIFGNLVVQGKPSLMFSMEMPDSDVALKLLANHGRLPLQGLATAQMTDVEWSRLMGAVGILAHHETVAFVDHTPAQTLDALISKVARLKRMHKDLALVVIDHLGTFELLHGQTAESVASALKVQARRLGIAYLVISHSDEPLRISADVILELRLQPTCSERTLCITKARRGEQLGSVMEIPIELDAATATFRNQGEREPADLPHVLAADVGRVGPPQEAPALEGQGSLL